MGALDKRIFSGVAIVSALLFVVSALMLFADGGEVSADGSGIALYILIVSGILSIVYAVGVIMDRPSFVKTLSGVFAAIEQGLREKLERLTVLSTICDATRERQEEALEIARTVDVMVVVGGRQSGNTRRLADLAAQCGKTTYHIEEASELLPENFSKKTRVGLTAGASTPKKLIDAAQAWLEALP